jgi:membrane protein implicated in regulation of membrane protease activity
MSVALIVLAALLAALAILLALRVFRDRSRRPVPEEESLLLEEAIVVEPVAPGLEGRAEIRKDGAEPRSLRIRASDSAQAFARGARVRVIDYREGCCFIESADQEHLVR